MKLLSIALGASLLASPVLAAPERSAVHKASDACKASQTKEVLSCHSEKPTRASKSVQIRDCGGKLVATITMPGMTDKPVEVSSVVVKHDKPVPHRVGGPAVYKGTDFELSINWTTTPVVRGTHRGHLKAKAGGAIDTDVACKQATAK